MKQSDLWAGDEYAYLEYRPRGVETPKNAKRIKLLAKRRVAGAWGSERMRTVIEFVILDKDTGTPISSPHTGRARDVVDYWDDYKDRLDDIKRREDAAKAEEERNIAEQKREQQNLLARLSYRTGIPVSIMSYGIYGNITLDVRKIREWLRESA